MANVPNPRGIAPRGKVAAGSGADAKAKKPAPRTGPNAPNPFLTGPNGMPVSATHAATDAVTGKDSSTVNVRGLVQQLRTAGYDLPAKVTTLTPAVLSALRDFLQPGAGHELSPALANKLSGGPISGNRNPAKWNQRFGTVATKSPAFRANTGPGGALNGQGVDVTPQYAGSNGTVDLSGQTALASNTGSAIPLSLAKFGSMIDPNTANAIAGEQFDPQIASAQLALKRDPIQALQDAKDISSWYGQVLDSLNTAAGRDTAATTSGVGSIDDATKALVSSLGGSANAGAGSVAAAGQNASGTLQALGAAQDNYNADLAPIFKNEQADQSLNQHNKDIAQQQNDAVALASLQGQRGSALTTAQDQIQQENNALAQARAGESVNIRGANNSLAQQGFNNSLALAQAQIAAMISGLTVQTKSAAAAKAQNPNAFAYASPATKNAAASAAWAALHDPTSGKPLNMTPQQAQATIGRVYSTYGWNPTTPAVGQAVNNVLTQFQSAPSG